MLLTNFLPENVVKKTLTSPAEISNSLETNHRDFSVRLNLLKNRLQKRHLIIARRNSEEPVKKRAPVLRRFSFPLLQFKNGSDEEMVTAGKETESYTCVLCRIHSPPSVTKIWKTDKNCSCMEKDYVRGEDIKRIAASLTEKMATNKLTSQEISDMVQGIYIYVDKHLQTAIQKGDITEDMATERMILFEKSLMRNLHCKLFSKVLEEEEKTDQNLSKKISRLHWVTAEHVAAKVSESNAEVIEFLHKAMLDIASMNFKESPAEKLECIMNCSRQIFALLKMHPGSSESADDYLPVLVYIILQVNPSHLHSNIKYILLFSNSDRVVKGEEGYYFTHLCSVVSFIEDIKARSLNISEEKYESYASDCLNNDRGQMLLRRNVANCICKIYNQAAETEALKEKQDHLIARSLALQKEMKLLKEKIQAESTRSKISKTEVSKFMASREERSGSRVNNFLSQQPNQTAGTEVSEEAFTNKLNPINSETNTLKPNNHIKAGQVLHVNKKSLNDYCDFVMHGTDTIDLKIPQRTIKSEQIHIFVPDDLLCDSTDVAFDVESYLIMNDQKER